MHHISAVGRAKAVGSSFITTLETPYLFEHTIQIPQITQYSSLDMASSQHVNDCLIEYAHSCLNIKQLLTCLQSA